MRVRICKDVEVDTEVSIGMEEIQSALAEAINEARDNPRSFSVQQFVSACWQSLNAMTGEQIALVGPANCEHVAKALHDLADRFDAQAVSVRVRDPICRDDIGDGSTVYDDRPRPGAVSG
jgi:hypothetical protein